MYVVQVGLSDCLASEPARFQPPRTFQAEYIRSTWIKVWSVTKIAFIRCSPRSAYKKYGFFSEILKFLIFWARSRPWGHFFFRVSAPPRHVTDFGASPASCGGSGSAPQLLWVPSCALICVWRRPGWARWLPKTEPNGPKMASPASCGGSGSAPQLLWVPF